VDPDTVEKNFAVELRSFPGFRVMNPRPGRFSVESGGDGGREPVRMWNKKEW